MPGVFVSHASLDRPLVDRFVETVLEAGCGLRDGELFYSSGAGTGVPTGANLNSYIQSRVGGAGLVVAIITPAFARSQFCVAELGAAWAVAGQLFPFTLPGTSYDTLGGVLSGLTVPSLDDGGAIDELSDRIAETVGRRETAQRWNRHRTKWLDGVGSYVKDAARVVVSMTGCSRTPGHMELFWTDGSGRVFQRWWLKDNGWSSVRRWRDPAAVYVAAVSRKPGDQWLFGMPEQGRVWARRWIRDSRGWDVPGPTQWIAGSVVGPLSAVRYGDSGLHLSARTHSGEPCYVRRHSGEWTAWSTDWAGAL